jgi:hypothetical protein
LRAVEPPTTSESERLPPTMELRPSTPALARMTLVDEEAPPRTVLPESVLAEVL